ncbi:Fe-S cluster assembly protein DRE2 [Plasmodium gonderi]|uniref:Anamorsin homolog n=1 Tax=Plasmodium gonderi TaxID=77519 RepID=A0A1Y1JAW5_PLAGO|nr:Fe-S cluster assembly protein DRE2 [Plasmodium gonderi]GAW79659.1 Fe-S cluster assembly protein DRE2 [Plasmodium gonderi]
MMNFVDTLIILNDDAPCELLRKKYIEMLVPTISVLNFKKEKIYKTYSNILLYTYKDYDFFWDLDDNILHKIQKCLKRNGTLKLVLYISKTQDDGNGKNITTQGNKNQEEILKKLKKECLYSGFINIYNEITMAENGVIINVTAENPDFLSNEDENYASSNDGDAYENAEDNKKTVNRVCANCTCGKKTNGIKLDKIAIDEKEVQYLTENAISSCGNCYLGDAFRCASCPYKGLPAFQPGENVKLNLNNETE